MPQLEVQVDGFNSCCSFLTISWHYFYRPALLAAWITRHTCHLVKANPLCVECEQGLFCSPATSHFLLDWSAPALSRHGTKAAPLMFVWLAFVSLLRTHRLFCLAGCWSVGRTCTMVYTARRKHKHVILSSSESQSCTIVSFSSQKPITAVELSDVCLCPCWFLEFPDPDKHVCPWRFSLLMSVCRYI